MASQDYKEHDDQQAQALLKKLSFDLDNISTECRIVDDGGEYDNWSLTPLIYFSLKGNLKMVQYLISRGADCRKILANGYWFAMYAAAYGGHVKVVQWLARHGGAKEDIRQHNYFGLSCLRAALNQGHDDVAKWLLPNRALTPRDDGEIDDALLRHELNPAMNTFAEKWCDDKRLTVLSWARDAVTIHEIVMLLLKGTMLSPSSSQFRRHPNNHYATRSKRMKLSFTPSSLVVLNGKSGILELIAEYAGNPKPKELRIFQQLLVLLPAYIEDTPFGSYAVELDLLYAAHHAEDVDLEEDY